MFLFGCLEKLYTVDSHYIQKEVQGTHWDLVKLFLIFVVPYIHGYIIITEYCNRAAQGFQCCPFKQMFLISGVLI